MTDEDRARWREELVMFAGEQESLDRLLSMLTRRREYVIERIGVLRAVLGIGTKTERETDAS